MATSATVTPRENLSDNSVDERDPDMNHYVRKPFKDNPDKISWCGIKLDPDDIIMLPDNVDAPHICVVCKDLEDGYVAP